MRNYEGAYIGRVDLRQAMVHSDNSVYAQLTQLVGPRAIVETAKRLGVSTELDPYFGIGLGQLAVNPLDMARAYATIAGGGRRVDGALFGNTPRVIAQVERIRSSRVTKNGPVRVPVLETDDAARISSILQDVVRLGTGRRAVLSDRPVAGKTGTTDDYGDAWFVGYTPQLVTAVWVGYPNELRPMRTEFHGEPVAGGTLPAMIWKEFMTRVVADRALPPQSFPVTDEPGAVATRVVRRSGWKLDNGFCPNTRIVVYFADRIPGERADCKPNEVTVPVVVGESLESARARLSEQQLGISLIRVPATRKTRPGTVVEQKPPGGFLSAGDTVRLSVATAQHGTLPNLIGSSYADVADALREKQLKVRVQTEKGRPGTVLRQWPRAGIAIEPGQTVVVVVGE